MKVSRIALTIFSFAAVLAGIGALNVRSSAPAAEAHMAVPRYTAEGALLRPKDIQTWVLTGASIGLGYSNGGNGNGPGEFHNVQMQPEAYEAYVKTGKFPEKTMLIITRYTPEQKVSINKHGYFEGELAGMEVALKDHEHFKEGWAYFDFSGMNGLHETARAFPKEMCYSCHVEHGADDNVFTQFYPILRGVKQSHSEAKTQ
jgi:hypothetical protein